MDREGRKTNVRMEEKKQSGKMKIFLRDGTLSRKRRNEDLAEKIETGTPSKPLKSIYHQNC